MVKLKYFGLVLLIASTAWAADPLPPAVVKREPISAIGQDLRVKLSVDKIKLDLLAGEPEKSAGSATKAGRLWPTRKNATAARIRRIATPE